MMPLPPDPMWAVFDFFVSGSSVDASSVSLCLRWETASLDCIVQTRQEMAYAILVIVTAGQGWNSQTAVSGHIVTTSAANVPVAIVGGEALWAGEGSSGGVVVSLNFAGLLRP